VFIVEVIFYNHDRYNWVLLYLHSKNVFVYHFDAGENDLRVAVTGGQVCGRQNGRRQNG
jgi:hypothetical protein